MYNIPDKISTKCRELTKNVATALRDFQIILTLFKENKAKIQKSETIDLFRISSMIPGTTYDSTTEI
ncbi:hypothetical protein BpHYR1_005145 [Brachionus plicatilis]|uniref:Uncharacterized protein n=1 Tax=Brachionus plicatilis TaxID=10195 RepID=A0A3M7SPH4_BRAPC|nr:hypothetical protein BpHYR1_005145 [Brachionus plicatilis]